MLWIYFDRLVGQFLKSIHLIDVAMFNHRMIMRSVLDHKFSFNLDELLLVLKVIY